MADEDSDHVTVSRRRMLQWIAEGLGAVAVAGATGLELVNHGVLPGKQILDRLDGACSVPTPSLASIPAGASVSGRFFSHAPFSWVHDCLSPLAHAPRTSAPHRHAPRLWGTSEVSGV